MFSSHGIIEPEVCFSRRKNSACEHIAKLQSKYLLPIRDMEDSSIHKIHVPSMRLYSHEARIVMVQENICKLLTGYLGFLIISIYRCYSFMIPYTAQHLHISDVEKPASHWDALYEYNSSFTDQRCKELGTWYNVLNTW